MTPIEYAFVWANAILSLMFISIVWKDTILSQIAVNISVGATIGHAILISLDTLYRTGLTRILQGNIITLGGLFIGILMFGRFTNYKWLARYPTQMLMAGGLGVAFGLTITTQIFGQINATLDGLLTATTATDIINAVLIFVGAVSVLAYFLFTFPPFVVEQRTRGAYGIVRRVARIFMMLTFGLLFATEEIFYLTVLQGRLWLIWKTLLGL